MSSELSASFSEQIQHHLEHCSEQTYFFGGLFSIHIDTVIMTAVLMTILFITFNHFSKKLTLFPSFSQNFFESIVDVVYQEAFSAAPEYVHTIGPLGLTVFIAVLFMNMMDFLPTSIGGEVMQWLSFHSNFKVVPTADLNTTLSLAFLTLLVIQSTVVFKHGLGHYLYGWLAQPLGLVAFPVNIVLRLVEEFSRVFSLAMRLYGNMFAGEIIFALLAIAPAYIKFPGVLAWCFFHILIVYIQAFIFMMLTVIGFSLALDH